MDFDKKDYYGVLGVSPNAEDFLIKAAYKALAQRYHPDKDKANHSGDKFKAINEAYSILSDVNKRQQYDDYLKKKNSNPPNQNQAQPEEQNTNDINQHNEELAAVITTLILSAVLTIVSVFAVLFVSVISSARNLYQKFTAYSDENAKRRQHEEELKRKQREEELKRKQREEDLKRKKREEELKRKQEAKPENGGYSWVIWFLVFAIPLFGVLSSNKEAVTPPPVSVEPVASDPQEVVTTNTNNCIGDCVDGWGTKTYSNAVKYTGNFRNGLPNGQGEADYPNGHTFIGIWENGTPAANQPEYNSTPVVMPEARKQTLEEASYKKQKRAEAKKQAKAEAQERRERAKAEAHYEAQLRKLANDQDAQEQAKLDKQIRELEEEMIRAKTQESGEANAETRKRADEAR